MLRFAANISLLFRERPLLDRIKVARDAGFEAVEVQFPYEEKAERLAAAARATGIPFILINAPIDGGGGMPGIACRPELAAAFLDGLNKAAEYAAALNVRMVNILAGSTSADERDVCLGQLADNLDRAVDVLGAQGVEVLLEPLNGIDNPGYIASTPADAIAIIRRCDGSNLRLQFDVYHAAMMGLDPTAELIMAWADVGHVQIADAPGRHEPGTGGIDFARMFQVLKDRDYDRWLSAEYHPLRATEAGLGWLRDRG